MRIYCELNQTKMCAVEFIHSVYLERENNTRGATIKSYTLLLNTWNAKSEK